jgi:hypothetical protein
MWDSNNEYLYLLTFFAIAVFLSFCVICLYAGTCFHEILYWRVLLKAGDMFQLWLKLIVSR